MNSVDMPLVSVVMPSYNGSGFIEASLLSVLEQEYPNIEIIVVNDGSTDTTKDIVASLQEKNDRILLINSPANQGIAKARNRGMEVAKGEYIAVLDCDDKRVDQNKIYKQVSFLQQHPDVGFLGTNSIVKRQHGDKSIFYKSEHSKSDKYLKEELLSTCPFTHSSVMHRKSIYDEIGGYPEHVKYASDYGYWLKVGTHTKFANLPDFTTLYNSHPDNTSHTHRLAQKMRSLSLSWQYRKDYPNAFKCLFRKTYGNLYSSLSGYMENHCPLLKDEIRKMLGRPTHHSLENKKEMESLMLALDIKGF